MALHAHPDDESLLTGGTLATLARDGHRVVLIVATDGESGLTAPAGGDLGPRRVSELERAAAVLGVHRVVRFGYPDSGDSGDAPDGFCRTDVDEVAERVHAVLRDEHADLLIGYDRSGGYGHPDHRQVHAVAEAAARRSGVRLLQATIDRTWLVRGMRLAGRVGLLPAGVDGRAAGSWFLDRSEITHRVRVMRVSGVKRRALACHASQTQGGGSSLRTVQLLARLPRPVFDLVAGTEWFAEPGARRGRRPLTDPFAPAGRSTP